MIIPLVVHRKIIAHSAELALCCGLTIILKMAGVYLRLYQKNHVCSQSFFLNIELEAVT